MFTYFIYIYLCKPIGNCFSQALVKKLLKRDIPGWVNRMANIGQCCSCLLPDSLTGKAPVNNGKGSDSGSSGYAAYKQAPVSSNFKAFAGSGVTLGASNDDSSRHRYSRVTSQEEPIDERREKMARAAAARLGSSNI
jgi:hypothetical protein